jgi:radical SAM/Cys-rich protein
MTWELRAEESPAVDEAVAQAGLGALRATSIGTIQVNVGLACNLACRHCHVESGPKRTERMDWETMELVLGAALRAGATTLDVTGGAPEMNPHFRRLVTEGRRRGLRVMVRTNLTILLAAGHEDLPAFYRDHRVHLVASLPCYLAENVDRQRGRHVHAGSIEALRRLNAVGYGRDADLPLDLVFNPAGPTLPPAQDRLEQDYRRALREEWGVELSRLIALTNMPIGRFQADLDRADRGDQYRALLERSFNPATLPGLMCRTQVHVGWDGTLHDCDFNHALRLPVTGDAAPHVRAFDPAALRQRVIATASHCLGCTAGAGSSCGGSLT